MATAAPCAENGFQLPNGGASGAITEFGRASAIGNKVYFTTYGYIGCFDPNAAPAALCAGASTGVAEPSHAAQYPLIPVRNSSGTLTAVCFLPTQTCLQPETNTAGSSGTTPPSVLPTVLASWETATSLPQWNTFNAGMWAEQGNKIYLQQGPSSTATGDVYCFDFTTADKCSGFGTNGVATGVGTRIYYIQNDPTLPNCLWTIGDAGVIRTFNGLTGAQGCSLAHPMADAVYTATVPRMSCLDAGRVTSWTSVVLDPATSGIALSDLRVSVLNSNGQSIPNYIDLTPNGAGLVDLSGLTTASTGTHPTFRISDWTTTPTAGAVTQVLATVTYSATSPQLCFSLQAVQECVNLTLPSGDNSVADGLLQTVVRSAPSSGSAQQQVQDITLAGTNTGAMCTPALGALTSFVPPSQSPAPTSNPQSPTPTADPLLAYSGMNSISIFSLVLGGLVAISLGGASLHVANRRRYK